MLKKTVTYTNADGATVNKDVYFNISANELVQKEADSGQKYSERLQEIANSNKLQDIYPAVLEMMGQGFGTRTEDGDFIKDPTGAAWEAFQNTLAFQALMDQLLIQDPENNGSRLADFINGMLPAGLVAKVNEQQATPGFRPGADTGRPTPPVNLGHVPATVVPDEPVVATPTQPVEQAPAEPVVEEVAPDVDGWANGDVSQDTSGVIQQTSEPRTPDLPGQAPQQ